MATLWQKKLNGCLCLTASATEAYCISDSG